MALVEFTGFAVTPEIGERGRLFPQDLRIVRGESQGLSPEARGFHVASEKIERVGLPS